MSIYGDFTSFTADAPVELFVLESTLPGFTTLRFYAGKNEQKADIVWQGQTYAAFPLEAEGFEFDGTKFPRPKIRVANYNGIFSALVRQYKDLVGAKVTRKRTTSRYLDAVNFAGGNPNANPSEHLPDEIFFITRKTSENKMLIEFELGSSVDLEGVMLPKRQVIAFVCPFEYRGEECGYAGPAVAKADDTYTNILSEDRCSKKITGCKKRFGENGELPFGGYPGAALLDLS